MEKLTLCIKCRHVIDHGLGGSFNKCGATRQEVINYVTGAKKVEFKYCSMTNKIGKCAMFKPKQ